MLHSKHAPMLRAQCWVRLRPGHTRLSAHGIQCACCMEGHLAEQHTETQKDANIWHASGSHARHAGGDPMHAQGMTPRLSDARAHMADSAPVAGWPPCAHWPAAAWPQSSVPPPSGCPCPRWPRTLGAGTGPAATEVHHIPSAHKDPDGASRGSSGPGVCLQDSPHSSADAGGACWPARRRPVIEVAPGTRAPAGPQRDPRSLSQPG